MFLYVILVPYYFYFFLLFIMGRYIAQMYTHSQSQISSPSFNAPVSSYLSSQSSSSIELTTMSVPSVRYKKQKISLWVPIFSYIILEVSQIITTYILVKHREEKL